jgi:tellurite resistance protein TehA-like permease
MFGLFKDAPAEFKAPLTPARALDSLAAEVKAGTLLGEVSDAAVTLRLNGFLVHRPYQPTFRGIVGSDQGTTVLRGTVHASRPLKAFAWFFMGFACLWTAFAVVIAVQGEVPFWMPFAGLIFMAMGYGFFSVFNAQVGRLADGLKTEIRRALARVA